MLIMPKLITIGEALIDFMPSGIGRLSEIASFSPCPGGAPANTASAAAALGVPSMVITKLGMDPFGDFLLNAIKKSGVDTRAVLRTSQANTGLAFVSHTANGERDFLFYRSPSSDMLLEADDIDPNWFEPGDILHFCSVALVDAPCRRAHDRAIAIAKEKGCIISFDVNLRFPLWRSADELKEVVLTYIPQADIVKVSREELDFLGDINAPCLIVTQGESNASYICNQHDVSVNAFVVPAIDTTGAGDSFIGSFLANVIKTGSQLPSDYNEIVRLLTFSHAVAAIVVRRIGALAVMPTEREVADFIAEYVD